MLWMYLCCCFLWHCGNNQVHFVNAVCAINLTKTSQLFYNVVHSHTHTHSPYFMFNLIHIERFEGVNKGLTAGKKKKHLLLLGFPPPTSSHHPKHKLIWESSSPIQPPLFCLLPSLPPINISRGQP